MTGTPSPPLTDEEMVVVSGVAVASIRAAVLDGRAWRPAPENHAGRLRDPGAAFVSLHLDGRLRGCIGTLVAVSPLVVTVADVARDAALVDPRFPPVEPFELPSLHVDVSVLSSPDPMEVHAYETLLDEVRPGVDGLIVETGGRRATLLPSVWDDLPTAREFVAALWRKAGLDPLVWPRGTRVRRYTAQRRSARAALDSR